MVISAGTVALIALGILPVALVPEPTTVLIWMLVVIAAVAADLLLAPSPARLEVRRTTPSAVRRGERATSTLTVTNTGNRPMRVLLRDAWQPTAGAGKNRFALHLPAGESRRVRIGLLPRRRGELQAHLVTVRSAGPLRLASRQSSRPVAGTLRVLPEFASRRHLPSRLARLREMDGRSAVNVRGQGTEFDSLREYVIGDDVRAIDWRASARRSEVMVRTWRPERDRRVMIVVDSSRLAAARLGEEPRLEAQIDAALLLTALAGKAGDRVDLLAMDQQVRARVRGSHGPTVMAGVADALSGVHPNLVEPDWTRVLQEVRRALSQRALVVLLTALESGVAETGLVPAVATLARDHQVVLASATDPATAELARGRQDSAELFDAAAAERAGLERAGLATRLRRTGAEVVERPPDELAPALADTYLALKAAGRL